MIVVNSGAALTFGGTEGPAALVRHNQIMLLNTGNIALIAEKFTEFVS